MKFRVLILLLITCTAYSQSIQDCQQRFTNYLNFKGTLNGKVKFEKDALYLKNAAGKLEFAVYETELNSLAEYFKHSDVKQQQKLMQSKGLKKFNKQQCDSLIQSLNLKSPVVTTPESLPLKGFKIALDPGHFSTSLKDAECEQKYLSFSCDNGSGGLDTVLIFESLLSFNTAHILKNKLTEQGAEVFVTRSRADHTSFDCTYPEWIKNHRKKTLDSLKACGSLSPQKHKHLMTCNNYDLFWDFFRDYDLGNRAAKINMFHPDISLIIHYNVDEKNAPWKKHTEKNFTMAFIGGGCTAENINKKDARAQFVRLLISDQLNQSEILSAKTVNSFNRNLNIPIAKASDATYLRDNCLSTPSPGVFCRNLALCRKINSPLVYGESLYQDNLKESKHLMKTDLDVYGIKTNQRVFQVANAYYEAVMSYLDTKNH